MNKSVVWIDDNASVMKEVVSYVFPKLWEKGITSYIRITIEPEKAVEDLNRIIYDQFVSYLISSNYIYDNEKAKEKENLVKVSAENANENGDDSTANVAKNISAVFDKYETQITKFYSGNKALNAVENAPCDEKEKSVFDVKNLCSPFEELVKEITGEFDKDTWFGIDLCLLEDDYNILKKNKDTPILSMALYNILAQKYKTVFLYTTYFVPKNIINGWKSIYKKFFNSDCSEINFYNRRGQNALNHEISDELVKIITEVNNPTAEVKND